GHFRPERLRQIDGARRIRRGAGGARAARPPGAGPDADRRERGVFRRPRHCLWVDDALRRTADDRLRDHRDADLASLLGAAAAERRTQTAHFAKNVAIIGGFLFLFVTGGGRYSLERWWRSSK